MTTINNNYFHNEKIFDDEQLPKLIFFIKFKACNKLEIKNFFPPFPIQISFKIDS